jgi:thymidylate synthase (FAD)
MPVNNLAHDKSFPYVTPDVFETDSGVRFLQSPGVAVISVPDVCLEGVGQFLSGFPDDLGFSDYLLDPTVLSSSESLCKFAGQLCYLSFGPQRTYNENADKYFKNIKMSSHGSVLEHANISMLWWGISRTLTHELVRHRAGYGFSQVSQRYVGGKTIRFVERVEFQDNDLLHQWFLRRIERSYREYIELTEYLVSLQKEGESSLSAERKTDLRKKVRQASRALLPNETEAPILVTANVRAWRHFLNMRVSEHAEVEIRRVGYEAYRCLYSLTPLLFDDFEVVDLIDGTKGLKTEYPKV